MLIDFKAVLKPKDYLYVNQDILTNRQTNQQANFSIKVLGLKKE